MDRIGFVPGVAARPPEQIPARAVPAAHTGEQAVAPAAGRPVDPSLSTFAILWQQKDQALARVQAAAVIARAVEHADRLVQEMQNTIVAMVKNYPPFPPGSEERLSYLRSISALRQQLEALTVPPEAEAASRIPATPSGPDAAADDAVWAAYAQVLDGYRQHLAGLRSALAEQVQSSPMWPEVGLDPPVESRAQQTLPQAAQALAGIPQALSQAGALQRAGLA